MKIRIVQIVLVLIFLLQIPVVNAAGLFDAEKLVCMFCSGTTVDWYEKEPEALIIKTEFMDKLCPSIIFGDINLAKKTAISREGDHETATEIWETGNGLSFLEFSYGRGVSVTTVFEEKSVKENMFLSVRSEHMASPRFPIPKQFFGACRVVD